MPRILRRRPDRVKLTILATLIGCTLIALSVFLCYGFADRLARILGATAMTVIMQLSSFLLVCIGVRIVWNGIRVLLESVTLHVGVTGGRRFFRCCTRYFVVFLKDLFFSGSRVRKRKHKTFPRALKRIDAASAMSGLKSLCGNSKAKPAAAKALLDSRAVTARLKPSPDEERQAEARRYGTRKANPSHRSQEARAGA